MVAVGQTITIVNNSGKVVSTSKHLINIFNEAKTAYNERKAEIKSQRRSEVGSGNQEKKARSRLEALTIADNDDAPSRRRSRHGSEDGRSRHGSDSGRSRHASESGRSRRGGDDGQLAHRKPRQPHVHDRPPLERGVSDSFYTNDRPVLDRRQSHPHPHKPSPLRSQAPISDELRVGELARRHTDDLQLQPRRPKSRPRSTSLDDIDMDLAYGELPPPLPERKYTDEVELRSKMTGLQRLLDEYNCLQHSVTSMIDNLQKNPDALAAVALTLGEISNLATKMAPGALTAMKGSFPTIIALLASPEFAIAAGVGVGVTIIALGGYKIIKKIKAQKAMLLENNVEAPTPVPALAERKEGPEEEMDELREISRIEVWRRGIADAEADSLGTSIDGEFITPHATRTLVEEGRLTEADLKPAASSASRKHRSHKSKSEVSSKTKAKSKSGSKPRTSKKEPSGLRMLFSGRSG